MSNIRKYLKFSYLLFLLVTIVSSSLDCNLLYSYLRNVNWNAMVLLNKMNKEFPLQCLSKRMDFELSQELLPPNQSLKDIKLVIYEMSQHIFNIFNQYNPLLPWEVESIQKIQIGLDQQIDCLQRCLEEDEREKEELEKEVEDEINYSELAVLQLKILELKKYFEKIDNFLKEKKYSPCAWVLVRLEIRRCFYILQKLISQLK